MEMIGVCFPFRYRELVLDIPMRVDPSAWTSTSAVLVTCENNWAEVFLRSCCGTQLPILETAIKGLPSLAPMQVFILPPTQPLQLSVITYQGPPDCTTPFAKYVESGQVTPHFHLWNECHDHCSLPTSLLWNICWRCVTFIHAVQYSFNDAKMCCICLGCICLTL